MEKSRSCKSNCSNRQKERLVGSNNTDKERLREYRNQRKVGEEVAVSKTKVQKAREEPGGKDFNKNAKTFGPYYRHHVKRRRKK